MTSHFESFKGFYFLYDSGTGVAYFRLRVSEKVKIGI